MLSETDGLNKTADPDDAEQLLEQIRARGTQLLEEFERLRGDDLENVLPDLIALRDDQDKILDLLEKIRGES